MSIQKLPKIISKMDQTSDKTISQENKYRV